MNAQKDELDRWLDEALAEYKAPEPRPGLDLRTLAYVRSHQRAPRVWNWRRWVPAAAAVIALAVALHPYWPAPRRIQPIAHRTQLRKPAPASAQTRSTAQIKMPVARALTRRMQTARIAVAAREPRLETFPSPLPLTPEERTLLGLVRQFPRALTDVAREQALEPIFIPEIKIPALEPNDQNSSGEKK